MNHRAAMLLAAGVLWVSAVSLGLRVLWNYESAPGLPATPPARWPDDSPLRRADGRATLLMFVHPHCPCSRASLEELNRILACCHEQVATHVLFYRPSDATEDWEKTDLWRHAVAMPGVHVMRDDEGKEAQRFNSATSGQALLYGADGELLFSGGITASRGHEGDNAGRSAIVSLLTGVAAGRETTPVFGCSLLGPMSLAPEEGLAHAF